jgi:hypothetical protein
MENTRTIDIVLSNPDLAEIEALLLKYPDTGDRYNESSGKLVDKS